jgi:hypothetical protein
MPLRVIRGRDRANARPREAVEEHVARERERLRIRVAFRSTGRAFRDPQEKDAFEAEAAREDRGRARVIRLDATARDDATRAARERVGEKKFELADLVSRLGAARPRRAATRGARRARAASAGARA